MRDQRLVNIEQPKNFMDGMVCFLSTVFCSLVPCSLVPALLSLAPPQRILFERGIFTW
jgi:hypothetical protein